MLGQRSAQRGMFEADTLFADFVGRRNCYGFLASQRDELFRDEDVLYAKGLSVARHRGHNVVCIRSAAPIG